MTYSDILMAQSIKTPISDSAPLYKLDHHCKTFLGIERDEVFIITKIIGDYEQLEITNQYKMKYIINPNQIITT